MLILFGISILSIAIFLILFFIIKSISKAIFITFTIFFVLSIIIIAVVVSDAKGLSKLQTSNSLFIYENENTYRSAISINFSESEPTQFTKDELSTLKEDILNKESHLSEKYFKIFIFSEQSINKLLSDNISVSEGVNFTKDELIKSLNSDNQDEVDSSFTISTLYILNNLQDKSKLSIFLNEYREKRIIIIPPIKAISLLSLFPQPFINSVLSGV